MIFNTILRRSTRDTVVTIIKLLSLLKEVKERKRRHYATNERSRGRAAISFYEPDNKRCHRWDDESCIEQQLLKWTNTQWRRRIVSVWDSKCHTRQIYVSVTASRYGTVAFHRSYRSNSFVYNTIIVSYRYHTNGFCATYKYLSDIHLTGNWKCLFNSR